MDSLQDSQKYDANSWLTAVSWMLTCDPRLRMRQGRRNRVLTTMMRDWVRRLLYYLLVLSCSGGSMEAMEKTCVMVKGTRPGNGSTKLAFRDGLNDVLECSCAS